jgi:DNA-binding MarR family transcriptional regulator
MTTREVTSDPEVDSGRPEADAALRQVRELRFLVLAAQREGNRQLAQALRPVDLTPAQAEIITTLDEHEPLTLATLGRYIVCESGSPSRLVDNLVQKGLVERENGTVDRRVVHLRLSPRGKSLVRHITEVDAAIDRMISERLAGFDLRSITDALRGIVRDTITGAKVTHRFPTAAPA